MTTTDRGNGAGRAIRGVLFDKDGTLFDFTDTWAEWVNQVLLDLAPDDLSMRARLGAAGGFDITTGRFAAESFLVNATPDEMTRIWANLHGSLGFDEINAICLDHLSGLIPRPVRNLCRVLDRLRSMGLTLGVATNDFVDGAEGQLAAAGVRDRFEFVCGYDSGFGGKPGTGMIEAFSSSCAIPLQDIAMIGDSTHDLIAGRSAGVGLVIGVLTGPATRQQLETDADVVLDGIWSLPDWLAGTVDSRKE